MHRMQGHILDSKEYYAPIITPYEAQLAFTPGAEWGKEYRLDFDTLLQDDSATHRSEQPNQARYSLIDSQHYERDEAERDAPASSALILPPMKHLSVNGSDHRQLAKVTLFAAMFVCDAA